MRAGWTLDVDLLIVLAHTDPVEDGGVFVGAGESWDGWVDLDTLKGRIRARTILLDACWGARADVRAAIARCVAGPATVLGYTAGSCPLGRGS
ncbi:hypothetical protein ABIA38_009067 [Embleya sp. AB8]